MMRFFACLCLLVAATLAGGCATGRPLEITPVGAKAAAVQPKFTDATYRTDRDGTMFVVMRSTDIDRATGQTVEQIMTMRIFWRPIGGRTSLNPTSLNATFRYIVMTPGAAGMYEGAGFVRLSGREGKTRTLRLLDGDLRLSEATRDFVDNLRRSTIKGNITARYDDSTTFESLANAQRDFFAKTLELGKKPINPPTTAPAATNPATAP